MRASEFLTAQQALWLVKVIFDQTYAVVNTSLQQRDQQAAAQTASKTAATTPRRKSLKAKRVMMPHVKAAPIINPKAANQAKYIKAVDKMKPVTLSNKAIPKTQQRSLIPIKPQRPVGTH